MKKLSLLARLWIFVAGLFAVGIAPSALAGDQDFTLVNDTGVDIHALFVSPSKTNDWEEDLLDGEVLGAGEEMDITFSPKERAAKWDIKVEDSKGNSITWNNLNLLKIARLTLHYKKGKAWADAE